MRILDGGQWLSGCLDGLDKDIKGKQKAALWRGQGRGQTILFSIFMGGLVAMASCPAEGWAKGAGSESHAKSTTDCLIHTILMFTPCPSC